MKQGTQFSKATIKNKLKLQLPKFFSSKTRSSVKEAIKIYPTACAERSMNTDVSTKLFHSRLSDLSPLNFVLFRKWTIFPNPTQNPKSSPSKHGTSPPNRLIIPPNPNQLGRTWKPS